MGKWRERWLAEQARCAQLSTGEQVPKVLLDEALAGQQRTEDTLTRVSDLLERWESSDGPANVAQARTELIEAMNRRDGRDVRMARLRTRVRELLEGLAASAQHLEASEGRRVEAEAHRDRLASLVDSVLRAPMVKFTEDGEVFMRKSVLLQALGMPQERPSLPVRPRGGR